VSRIVAAGVGCRKGCEAGEIVALVRLALQEAALDEMTLSGLFAPVFKHGESGLAQAAELLGVPLVLIPEAVLKAAEPRVMTTSEKVVALIGLASIAETAALAGAGPASRLTRPRIASKSATCAIAISGDAP